MSECAFAAADLTAMKIIDIRGIPNMEPVRGGTDEWYWATDYIHGDLYEAEELFRDGHPVKSNGRSMSRCRPWTGSTSAIPCMTAARLRCWR